jgi:hypothetical protein
MREQDVERAIQIVIIAAVKCIIGEDRSIDRAV